MNIASNADYARDHYIFRRETNRRDGSIFIASIVARKRVRNWLVDLIVKVLG